MGGGGQPCEAHLQADDVASLLQLLWGEAAVRGLDVLHPHVVLSVEALGLSLGVGELEMDRTLSRYIKRRVSQEVGCTLLQVDHLCTFSCRLSDCCLQPVLYTESELSLEYLGSCLNCKVLWENLRLKMFDIVNA